MSVPARGHVCVQLLLNQEHAANSKILPKQICAFNRDSDHLGFFGSTENAAQHLPSFVCWLPLGGLSMLQEESDSFLVSRAIFYAQTPTYAPSLCS